MRHWDMQFQSSIEISYRYIVPTDAELTSTADVNEQLSITLVRHYYSLLVFVGSEGRQWDGCQRSKVKSFTKNDLSVYLLNCSDIKKIFQNKCTVSKFTYHVYVVVQWENKQLKIRIKCKNNEWRDAVT
jgi:hypothetical protein